jgi:hypothetical protein
VEKPAAADLHVLSTAPQGKTASPQESQTIVVIFDRPVVALEALPEDGGPAVLQLNPPSSGKTRWLGSKTLTFSPDRRFPLATAIQVTIPAGTRGLDGSILRKDHTWSFETVEPRLVRHFPRHEQKWLGLDTQVLLIFNQEVEKNSASGVISFSALDEKEKEEKVDFRLSSPSPQRLKEADLTVPAGQCLLLEPRGRLKAGASYFVEVRPGLSSREGPLKSSMRYHFHFETFKEFRFTGLAETARLNPEEPLQFKFNNPVLYKDLVSHLTFEPPLEIPEYYGEWEYGGEALWLSLSLQPETEYVARLDAGLKDEFGNSLSQRAEVRFSTSSYPPSISMTSGHGVLEASGAPRYPISAMNVDSIFFQAARLTRDQVIPLLRQPKIFWSNEPFGPAKGFSLFEKRLTLKLPRNQRRTMPLPFDELLPDNRGLLFLQVDTEQPEDKWDRYPKAVLQFTELGISGKFSPDNNVVWVTELSSGLPVPEADVEIRDDQNRVKWKGKTDDQGKAESPGWMNLGLRSTDPYSEPQQWVFAGRGGDLAFASSEWGTGIDPYRFNIPYDWQPRPALVQGAVFSERGIYRAGEEAHLKGIVRKSELGRWELPGIGEVSCEIQDPFQKVVFTGKASLDEFGSFSLDYTSPEDAALGFYQVITKMPPQKPGEKETVIAGSFRVEAFRPAEFEVHLRARRESIVFGQDYEAEARASYLYGGAMSGQGVSWYLRLNRTSFSPPGFDGFIFGNELDWGNEETEETSRLASSGQGVLDSEGKLKVKLPLRAEKEKDSVMATWEATVTSPSRRSITNRIQTMVHRGTYYVGLKPATSFLRKGDSIGLDVVAANPGGEILQGKKINVKLVKREWRSARKAGVGGRLQWITERDDLEVDSRDVTSGKDALNMTFQPEKAGFYFFLASSSDGLGNAITTTSYFYVTGEDYVPWERRDDDSIELVADDSSYRPGETARILVKSPYEKAKALLTVERDFIMESRILDITGTASHIEVPIRTEYLPNVFVSVLLVQGRAEVIRAGANEDVGKPSFRIGYVKLAVDPREKKLSVEVNKDKEQYKPRDPVKLKFRVADSGGEGRRSSLAVAVVDVGVLNLIGYETPDPFAQFYAERPLSVRTSETRLHVVGRREYGEKGEEVGGGAAEGPGTSFGLAEVELRGDFRTTAYWNPSLITDENGQAEVTFPLPDNLTTFRVMAVAQTKDSLFGRGETTFRVTKTLLLQAALPRFARVGDTFEGGVLIHNFSPAPGDVVLSAEATGIRLPDERREVRFALGAGESREVLFPLEAVEPGKATLAFRAKMGESEDGLEASIPVQLPRPTETVALAGETSEKAEERIAIPADVFPQESRVDIQAASSALLGLKAGLDELADYPYACLEQKLSALLPYIVSSPLLLDFHLILLNRDEVRKRVQEGLRQIHGFQKDSGGLGAWPESAEASPFLTCYAVFALIKAREAGYAVDQDTLDRAVGFLQDFLRREWRTGQYPFGRRTWKTVRAFALYVLSLRRQPEPAYAEKLFMEREDLSIFGRTLLLKALEQGKGSQEARQTLLQELLNMVKVTAGAAHFEADEGSDGEWIYSSSLRTTALILQMLIESGREHPLLPSIAKWIVEKMRATGRLTTQENFFAVYALNEYYRKYETMSPDFQARILLAGGIVLDERFKSGERRVKTVRKSLAEVKTAEAGTVPMQVEKSGDGLLYYGARLTYAPRTAARPRDEGLAVWKNIESLSGRPLDAVPAGALVVVKLEIALPQETLFVIVNDPLPAGLEAVNPSFRTESEEEQRKLRQLEAQPSPYWRRGFNHIEMHDDRVLLFADSLAPGIHTHRYLARALSFGSFVLPGTTAEKMYAPEVFGRSAERTVRVVR